jgi:2-oxoglutarate ferredoxin oxidoreductase subunit alpha
MLIRALPLTSEVRDFFAEHDTIYFVEQNRDGQMAAILKDECPELGTKIVSVLIYNGLPATPLEVVNQFSPRPSRQKLHKDRIEKWQKQS